MRASLNHDAAFAMAMALIDIVRPRIRQEEQKEVLFSEFYQVCLAGIQKLQLLEERMQRRLKPGHN